jgi:hypothetical protein
MARNFHDISFCLENKDSFFHIHVEASDNIERFKIRSWDVASTDSKQLAKRASDDGKDVYKKQKWV